MCVVCVCVCVNIDNSTFMISLYSCRNHSSLLTNLSYAHPLLKARWTLERTRREVEDLTRAWSISYDELQLIERIDIRSRGAFGEVWKALYHDRPVAVKQLKVSTLL